MRGAVTSGKEWMFFVYNAAKDGRGGSYRTSPILCLDSVEERDVVVGLLKIWVSHAWYCLRCGSLTTRLCRLRRGTRMSTRTSSLSSTDARRGP